jgi:hypothetical protein
MGDHVEDVDGAVLDVRDRHPGDRIRGAADLEHLGLGVGGDRGGEDQGNAVVVLVPSGRCGAGEVDVVDAEQLTHLGVDAALLVDLATQGGDRLLAVSMPPPGSVQVPGR